MGGLVPVLYTPCPFTSGIPLSFVKHFQQRFIAWENAFFFRFCDVDDGNPQVFPSLYSSRQAFYVLHRVILRLQHELQHLCIQLYKQLFQCKFHLFYRYELILLHNHFRLLITYTILFNQPFSKDYLTGET